MGIGLGLVFVPSCLIVQQHFHDRKALMTGIVMSGSSFGALVYPVSKYLISHCLFRHSNQNSLVLE
jgi:cyanophycinase-like exopeptidase